MTHLRLEDLPDHLAAEEKHILDLFMQDGDLDDDVTDEEVDQFMWDHASEELRAEWTRRDAVVTEARSRGAYAG